MERTPEEMKELIAEIVEAGLLTERQAEAYLLRDLEECPRQYSAECMSISVNTLDNTLAVARNKVEQAKTTVQIIESADNEEESDR